MVPQPSEISISTAPQGASRACAFFVHARRGKTASAALKTTPSAGGIPRCAAATFFTTTESTMTINKQATPKILIANQPTQRRQNPAYRAPTPDDFGGYTRKDRP
jgi:hypothetical protein